MSLELWLGPQTIDQSRETPRTVLLPNGNVVIFTTESNSVTDHYVVIDRFGNEITSGRIDIAEGGEFFIDDVIPRPDGGFDILYGSGFSSIPTLYLLQIDGNFEQVGPIQEIAPQYGGDAEFVALPNGTIAVAYGSVDSGVQNVELRIIAADGTVSDAIQANTSNNPGSLFTQIAANDQVVFTAWLDTANGTTIRGRIFDHDGNAIGDEFSIASSTGNDNRVYIDTLSDGTFVVGFVRLNSAGDSATPLIRLFGATGQPLGDEFAVGDGTSRSQFINSVEALEGGGFLATWSSANGIGVRQFDGSGTRVTGALLLSDLTSNVAIEQFDDGRFLIVAGGGTFTRYAIVDGRMGNLDGDEGDNVLIARTSGPSTINGFGGDDEFFGFGQDDTFIGGEGNDIFHHQGMGSTLIGGTGDDTYFVSDFFPRPTIIEQIDGGIDTVATFGFYNLPDNVENVIVIGDRSSSGSTRGNDLANVMTGNDNRNEFHGLGGDDVILGLGGDDRLEGGDGNDRVEGGEGIDILFGGAGDDLLLGGEDGDQIEPGMGTDRSEGGAGDDTFVFQNGDLSAGDVIVGGSGRNFISISIAGSVDHVDITGVVFSDIFQIVSTDPVLMTRAQFEQFELFNAPIAFADGGTITLGHLTADSSIDARFIFSDFGNLLDARNVEPMIVGLTVFGGAGNDTVFLNDNPFAFAGGGAGSDILVGGTGDNTLHGDDGVDQLTGGLGDDLIRGGSNVDTAIVSGTQASYTITQTFTGVFEITGADGTDTLFTVEYLQFDDGTVRLLPGTGVSVNFETADPSVYQAAMNNIRDFDGNELGGSGGWLRIGSADVNGDGDIDQILVNQSIGRFATVGTADGGLTYFSDFSWAGETRVAGIYIDPLVASGGVEVGGPNDSQRRFQNDLEIENINRVLGADDYDGDGLQEVYFALTDGTAYLHAYMHADGNIQYANYQSEQEVIDFLTANGFDSSTWADWFPSGHETPEANQNEPEVTVLGAAPNQIYECSEDAWGAGYVEPHATPLAQFQFVEAFA